VASSPPAVEHKQVTVLFADVVGSMELAAVLDPERLREVMNELFNRAAAVVQRYQGTVDKFTGDGLMALFGAPVALEDHALRACISALEIQTTTMKFAGEVLRQDGVDLRLRVGLNSGEVIAGAIGSGPGRYTAVGHSVGIAQRMEAAAPATGVLCSLSTAGLVEGIARLGEVEEVAVKGADEPARARQLLGVDSDRIVLGRNEGQMLGRDGELGRLQRVLERSRGSLVGIVGGAGLGKSRLIEEFTAAATETGAHTAIARCEAHTTTVAFHALSRLLRALFGIRGLSAANAREHALVQCADGLAADAADARILFDVMGIADPHAPALAVSVDGRRRRLVELMSRAVAARSARTVIVLEDAHWIDAPSDEVLAEFAATLGPNASVVVATYRPEFGGSLRHRSSETITLRPLTSSVTVCLVRQLLGDDASLSLLSDRIVAAAAGNPFFVEEIVRDLADRGVLSGSRGSYRAVCDVPEISAPATVQSVIAARIDRLGAETKAALNTAAVIGDRFDRDLLQDLLPRDVSSCLAELVSAEMIDQTEFVPRQRFCFRHPLVRTVAYESQLSSAREHAHSRLAAALEARDPGGADQNAALIATHCEAAGERITAYQWHMRAANWLRPRDLAAARTEWRSALRVADQMSNAHRDVIALRIAPRTMLISTESFVGSDADADEQYRELRTLAMQVGDLRSLAIATAGRIMSFTFNDNRVPDAAALGTDLEQMISRLDIDEVPEIEIILIGVIRAFFANSRLDAAMTAVDAILARPQKEPTLDFAGALTIGGVIELYRGNYERGRRYLIEGLRLARELPPVSHAIVLSYWGILAVMGVHMPGFLIDEAREALRRAESFGDICGVITAQFAYGAALLRADEARRDEAIEVLHAARERIAKYRVMTTNLMPAISADLALDAARRGQRDEAIDDLRALFTVHAECGVQAEVGCAGEALVTLLIDRATPDDLAEAHCIVDGWRERRLGIPAADLWWLKSRALLAEAEGDSTGYAELSAQYLALCRKLDARGRLVEAYRMFAARSSED
jgi:adenylate cyclase